MGDSLFLAIIQQQFMPVFAAVKKHKYVELCASIAEQAYEKMSPKAESQSRGRAATPNKARRVWGGAPKLGQPSGALLRDRPGRYVDIANDTQTAQATKEFILDLAGEEV